MRQQSARKCPRKSSTARATSLAAASRLQLPSSFERTLRPLIELSYRNMCIARARARGGREYADDAVEMLLAEQLVGEARARRARSMDTRERAVVAAFAALYCVAAVVTALVVPADREVNVALVAALVVGHAAVSRVRFEFGGGYVVPEQLVIVPMLLLGPLPFVPILIAAAGALALVPDFVRGSWSKDRWLNPVADCWPYLVPVLILGALAPGAPTLDSAPGLCACFRGPARH